MRSRGREEDEICGEDVEVRGVAMKFPE